MDHEVVIHSVDGDIPCTMGGIWEGIETDWSDLRPVPVSDRCGNRFGELHPITGEFRPFPTEILARARSRVASGWTRGCHARDETGMPVSQTGRTPFSFSLVGALCADPCHVVGSDMARDILQRLLSASGLPRGETSADDSQSLTDWNNAPGRCRQDVLDVFDRAIGAAAIRTEEDPGPWEAAVSAAWYAAADPIAARHHAAIVTWRHPDDGRRQDWVSVRNETMPAGRSVTTAVLRDLAAAGLWDAGTGRPIDPDPDARRAAEDWILGAGGALGTLRVHWNLSDRQITGGEPRNLCSLLAGLARIRASDEGIVLLGDVEAAFRPLVDEARFRLANAWDATDWIRHGNGPAGDLRHWNLSDGDILDGDPETLALELAERADRQADEQRVTITGNLRDEFRRMLLAAREELLAGQDAADDGAMEAVTARAGPSSDGPSGPD